MSSEALPYLDEDEPYIRKLESSLVHLVKIGLAGNHRDLSLASARPLSEILKRRPDLSSEIVKVTSLRNSITRGSNTSHSPIPVDVDSRLELLRRDDNPRLAFVPTWPQSIERELRTILQEIDQGDLLRSAGLEPTRSMLLVGPPGVGKTVAARWIAERLSTPLLTLDLSSVMSSYLGKTGGNIRGVLEYAKKSNGILLLDEFDSIAKRRDDSSDVGELKRLVTVLLQEIDDWPSGNLLIAATNHPELLDPAIWRRFDRVLKFPLPDVSDVRSLLKNLLGELASANAIAEIGSLLVGRSFADITKLVAQVRRESLLSKRNEADTLASLVEEICLQAPLNSKLKYAKCLREAGRSERIIAKRTGISRDTLRKRR
jgi:SpoVK/Ycf46/Vps4 family AAA+-type ATPase